MGKIKMCKIKQNFALEFSYQMEVGTKIYEAKIVNIINSKIFQKNVIISQFFMGGGSNLLPIIVVV